MVRKRIDLRLEEENPDIICLQEIKSQYQDIPSEILEIFSTNGYDCYWDLGQRAGHFGVCIFTREKVLHVQQGVGSPEHDQEGRFLLIELENVHVGSCYFPNARHELSRLDFKTDFNQKVGNLCTEIRKDKPVILCGDMNVAHQEIDLFYPKKNQGESGFHPEERKWLDDMLHPQQGIFVDAFRVRYPDAIHKYTWWDYRTRAREKNIGWRIDYFLVDKDLQKNIRECTILDHILGSDHCPISLDILM